MSDLDRAVAALAGEERSEWSNAALSDRLIDLLAAKSRLDAEILALIGLWDARSAWADDGARSPRAWLDTRADLTRSAASQLVRAGRTVFAHHRVATSLEHGDLSPAHVDVLARANTAGREDLFTDHQDALVDSAVTTRTVTDFEAVTRQWTAAADDIVDDRRSREIDESYGIDLSETLHGTVRIDGLLPPEAGALVRNALHSEPDPLDREPRRTARQRRADRLVDLCRHEITDPKQGRGSGAEILIHVDYDTLVGLRTAADRSTDTTPASGSMNHPHATAHRPRHDLDGSGPVRPSIVRQMACDGVLRRVVVDCDGEILDLGRRQRVVSDAQRRAVIARDRHCRFPGCRAPARNCQVHHIVEWADGGPTDLDNLCLACWHHHRLLHTTRWTLQKSSDGNDYTATRPDGTEVHDSRDRNEIHTHELPERTQSRGRRDQSELHQRHDPSELHQRPDRSRAVYEPGSRRINAPPGRGNVHDSPDITRVHEPRDGRVLPQPVL